MFIRNLSIATPLVLLMVLISIIPTYSCAETIVSESVQLNESTIQHDRRTGTSSLNVSIRNISTETFLYPIKVVIESISTPDVTLINPDGQTLEGKPYFFYTPPQGSNNNFATSQLSPNKRWTFKNSNRVRFTYQTKVLASKYAETLIPPSEISQTPHPIIGRDMSTREYVGQLDLPSGLAIKPSSLFVKTQLAGQTALTQEGLFQLVMNSNATTLMTVVKPDGNQIMMKLFPKGEYLVETNPIINAKSTAIALVALEPGFLTTVPQLDAMLLAALNTLTETQILADQIAYEIEQGSFSANGPYSESIKEKIIAVHLKFETLRAEDVLDLPLSAKIGIHLKNVLNSVVSSAYAAIYAEQCSDSLSESFQGTPGNRDEICISANIKSDENGIWSGVFNLTNRKSRWAVFKDMGIAAPSAVFDWIPPRHISSPSAFDFLKGFLDIGTTAVSEVFSSNYWKSIFDPSLRHSETNQALDEFTNKYLGARQSVAHYRFPELGENKLSTISFSKNSAQLNNAYVDFWAAPTLVLTMVTEVVAPVVSVGMELNKNELDDAMSRDTISGCVTKDEFKPWIALMSVDLVQLLSESDENVPLEDKFDFFVNNLILERKAHEFLYCIAGTDLKAYSNFADSFNNILEKAFVKAKIAAGVANIFVTFRDGFNEDLAPIDNYNAFTGYNMWQLEYPYFTKLDNNGNLLPANAGQWNCVRDEKTDLIWESKTTGGLHGINNTYSWYEPSNINNPGVQNGGSCSGSDCDTLSYVQAVNTQGLCGARDWRIPDTNELFSVRQSISHWRFGKLNGLIDDAVYFPYLPSSPLLWSASGLNILVALDFATGLWSSFGDEDIDFAIPSDYSQRVRLVRGGLQQVMSQQ